ncbi:glycosyltransferase involved in cell wall biosynthesis [Roseiarcus fermentans]|uniref:Glycosyltransferase involved in cell wall biosynthesis n=1 Tax=Roseiarcus fermentans TaxID=1473586 RepID=A0A366FLM7_9HYPH|nr:glycosyltransferase [Roseiarcus fermentans]RBP15481.1 glycosyltransferase involved in cell wall biosynthesis [Roseiarcus fermentans]
MNGEPFSPFGRGADAPLAGRTIMQIASPASAGADRRATVAVAEALVEAGARALVLSERDELASEAQAVGALHVPFPASSENPISMMLNVRRLARILAAERVDLVHARSRSAAWVALGAARTLGRALVTSIPGEGPTAPPRTRFESAIAEGDLVVAASDYAAGRVLAMFPAAAPRLRLVRPGLDVARFSPEAISRQRVGKARERWGVASHERVVLAPGRLAPGRGQALMVEAAALLAGRGLEDLRWVLAGEGQKPSVGRELDQLAVRRGVKDAVVRLGAEVDRPAAFVAASVVAFPTRDADGVTRAVIEAAAAGALVIVADVGAASEVVFAPPHAPPEQRTGWLVPPGDAGALAEAIETALTLGASAREATRRRSRERTATFYSAMRMTGDTLAVYAEALQQRGL